MDSDKLTVCKTCGKQIAKSAKKCPHCGAKVSSGVPKWLIAILVVVAVFALIRSMSDSITEKAQPTARAVAVSSTPRPAQTPAPTSTPKPTPTPEPVFAIGDTAEMRDLRVTLTDVRNGHGNSLYAPDPGNVYLVFELEVENISDKAISISSLLSFSAYADDYALDFSLYGSSDDSVQTLGGELASGKKMRGVIAYDAPEDWQVAEIRFKPNVWGGKEYIFTATNPDA